MIEHYFISLCLIIVFVAMLVLSRCCDQQGNFYLRVRSWWWMLLLLTIVTFSGHIGFELLLCTLAGYGAFELLRVEPLSKINRYVIAGMFPFAVCISLINPYWGLFVIFIATLRLLACKQFIYRTKSIAIFLYLLLFLSFISMLQLLNLMVKGEHGSWLLYLFFVTQINDVSQYFWGKSCGRTLLLPKVSPSKTLEGALGGIFTSSLLGTAVGYYLLDFQPINGLLISMVLAIAGICGDLLVSLFKRRCGIKDMGKLIPGHGGLLDRIDSLLLSAPLLWLIGWLIA